MHNCKEFDAMANAVLTENIEAQNQGYGSPYLRAYYLGLGPLVLKLWIHWTIVLFIATN